MIRNPLGCLFEIAQTLVMTAIIFIVIHTFVAQPFQIDQVSMRTTLDPGEYVLVDKLTPRFTAYERGDIVVFHPPSSDPDAIPFIKRIIGVSGDRIELRNGGVAVNGIPITEPYVHDAATRPLSGRTSWTVPEGSLFVMGDNREQSIDSRAEQVGMVPTSEVIGRAWLRYWPLPHLGFLDAPTYPDLTAAEAASGGER